MSYDIERLRLIYNHTDGHCHICGKKLSFVNYAASGTKGAWEVEHSIPKALGGTDNLNNLFPACIMCNRSKGTGTSRAARIQYGRKRAPLSRDKKASIQSDNALVGVGLGTIVGSLLGGVPGALVGAVLGGIIGHDLNPETDLD